MKTPLPEISSRPVLSFFLFFPVLLASCKKDEFITFEGRLLISNTNPVAVANFKISFYQAGSPGIPAPLITTSAGGFATTDNNGNYSTKFKLGKSTFIVFSGTNPNPVSLQGEASGNMPGFYINNVPADAGTIYLYKKIDTAVLILS